jgi:hypothetical protein
MIRPARSVAMPLLLTTLVLLGLTFAVADFRPIRVEITKLEPTGRQHLSQSVGGPIERFDVYQVQGIADDGGNPYHQISYIQLTISRGDTRVAYDQWIASTVKIDPAAQRFSCPVNIAERDRNRTLYLEIAVHDRAGRSYGWGRGRTLAYSPVPIRVE